MAFGYLIYYFFQLRIVYSLSKYVPALKSGKNGAFSGDYWLNNARKSLLTLLFIVGVVEVLS
jgi:hypothetical protein